MDLRQRRFNIVVGSPGSGKTTFTSNIVRQYKQNVCFIKHLANIDDPALNFLTQKTRSNWRQGAHDEAPVKFKLAINDIKIEDEETGEKISEYRYTLKWVKKHFRNGMLIVDDATIFERDRLTEEMNHLVSMRRHYGIDIWLIYHGLTLLPIEQFIFLNNLVLFNTNDNLKYKANKLPNADHLQRAVIQARNNYNSKDKKVKYTPVIHTFS